MYSLPIRDPDRTRKFWWANFTETTRLEKYGPGLNFTPSEWLAHRDTILKTHNATYDGTHVHFVSEQDAMMFMLRYS